MTRLRPHKTPTSRPAGSPAGKTKNSPRPFAAQAERNSQGPPIREAIEKEGFQQNRFEAFGLQLKKKHGAITLAEQARLGVLQAKMDEFWAQRMERMRVQPESGKGIQRKVGFEFQTVGGRTRFEDEDGKKEKISKAKFYEAPGFNIEPDEGDLELVTKPFEETESGFQEMASTISYMEVFAEQVEGKKFPIMSLRDHFASARPQAGLKGHEKTYLKVEDTIKTEPQTTVGIKLDKLVELASLLGNAKPRDQASEHVPERTSPLLGQDATKEALADHIGWKNDTSGGKHTVFQALVKSSIDDYVNQEFGGFSNALKGFLFMLVMYANAERLYGEASRYPDPYWAKLAIPIVSRTNLADLFLILSPEDQEIFIRGRKKIAIILGGKDGGDRPLFKELPGEHYRSSFSIHDWLDHLVPPSGVGSKTPGLDFSAAYESLGDISNRPFDPKDETGLHPHIVNRPAFDSEKQKNNADEFIEDKTEARNRYGLGSKMVTSTDIGKATDEGLTRTDGLIVELRKLGARLTRNEWWSFASDVFKLTVLLNQGQERRDQIVDAFIDS